ncbi:metalloprotease [Clostridium folliculivorans]|uniref:Metalloprotease n=1 Tax=Clostridium folliculivorans TaxID=2886038 RepID=A0A9W5XYQ3_9CLOT|nr:metalloprotease [Clostridium folliculivorans]GKU29514.1 metalloprotease [Clostridium folliculivorans]
MVKISKWLIPQILIFFILGFKSMIFLGFLWIIFHEMTHYVVAKWMNLSIDNFKIHPFGTALELSDFDGLTHKEEILLSISGPAFNFIMFGILYMTYKVVPTEFINNSMEINLALGMFNMLPAYPLDGSKILRTLLSSRMFYKKAHIITSYISYGVGMIGIGIFIYLSTIHIFNLSVLLTSCFILFITYNEKRKVMYIIMGDIIKKRTRLGKKKYIYNKTISVHFKLGLINVLGLVDKNKFNTFYILDDELRLTDVIHEDELIEALKTHGNITLEEYINYKNSWMKK